MYNSIRTEDGSPTVRIGESEAMHSLKGAFSETVYIYGTAIETALTRGFRPSVLSMGLGLGYVEILAVALMLKHGSPLEDVHGESFEIVPDLRTWFRAWVCEDGAVPADFAVIYEQILTRTSTETGVEGARIRTTLAQLLRDGRWQLREALEPTTAFATHFGCICFDAFSSKSTPEVWTEDFLNSFLSRAASPQCVLSTYACTGALKRSLRNAGFELNIREGYASKRDSTFAVRAANPVLG